MSNPVIRRSALLIFLTIAAAALLSSHQHTPFPLLIDEAQAATIICNPVLTGIPQRSRKVVRT